MVKEKWFGHSCAVSTCLRHVPGHVPLAYIVCVFLSDNIVYIVCVILSDFYICIAICELLVGRSLI